MANELARKALDLLIWVGRALAAIADLVDDQGERVELEWRQQAERTVIGLLIDVSGSMRDNIRNETVSDLSRFQSVLSAVDDLARQAASIATARLGARDQSLLVFAYGFGFRSRDGACDLLSLLGFRSRDDVCDLLSLLKLLGEREEPGQGETRLAQGGEPSIDDFAVDDPYGYLRAVATKHRRVGWADWIDKNLDRPSAANVAANVARHVDLSRMLEKLLPDLSYEDIAYLLSLERSMEGKGRLNQALAGTKHGYGQAAQSALVGWKVARAGGPGKTRDQVAVAHRIVSALSSAILDESGLRKLLNDPALRELSPGVWEELLSERLAQVGETTLPVGDLVELLRGTETSEDVDVRGLLYGGTPMCQAVEKADSRFERLLGRMARDRGADSVLVIVSDGEPTDGDPRPIVERVRARGILVISCYVTDRDVQAPRTLPVRVGTDWSEGARLMFECASVATNDLPQTRYLIDHGWTVPEGARFFAQVNHSAILSEFLRSAIG